jgi:branched-chain amino acid transport system permease protein
MTVVPSRPILILMLLLGAAFLAAPLIADTYYLKLLTRILILALFALSLDLLVGFTGLVSLGHAAFFGLAGYALQMLSPEYSAANLLWILPAALAATAVAAAAIGALCVRTKGIYFIMVTLAFAQMLFYLFHDSDLAGGSDGAFIFVKPALTIFGVTLLDLEDRLQFYYLCFAALLGSYLLLVVLLRSPFGEAIQGIKVNEHRMRALGYHTYGYKLVAFVIAGTMAGLAGFLFASIDGFVAPEYLEWHQSGLVLVIVILGGLGTLFGPILGALVYVGIEEIFRDPDLWGPLAEHWQLLKGAFIIAVVMLMRGGIAGLLNRLSARRRQAPTTPTGLQGARPEPAE